MHKHFSRGFSHVIPLLVLVIVAGAAFFTYTRVRSSIDITPSQAPGCAVTDGIEVCLSADKADIAYNDTATLTSTIKNVSRKVYTWSESTSTCSESSTIELNNEVLSSPQLCTLESSYVERSLQPGQTRTYEVDIIYGDELSPGSNTVKKTWGEAFSGELILTGHEQTTQEAADAERCLAGEVKTYCLLLPVRLDDQYYDSNSTCEEIGRYFDRLGLSPSKCDDSQLGKLQFSVPVLQAESWKSQLKALNEVSSVDLPTRSDGNDIRY